MYNAYGNQEEAHVPQISRWSDNQDG